MARQGQSSANAIDNLMMSCADLKAPAKSSGFKGPAMKDLKVTKSEVPKYRTSAKARDWSCLAHTLEDAFSSGSGGQPKPSVAPPVWTQPFNAATSQPVLPPSGAPHSLEPVNPAVSSDDWGDFMGATSASSNAKCPSTLAPRSEPSSLALSSADSSAFNGGSGQHHGDVVSGRDSQITGMIPAANGFAAEDEFSDFVSPSPTPSATSSGSAIAVMPPPPLATTVVGEDRSFADFGGFQATSSSAIGNSLPAFVAPSLTSTTPPSVPQSSSYVQPTQTPTLGDKYANLRDLFGLDKSGDVQPSPLSTSTTVLESSQSTTPPATSHASEVSQSKYSGEDDFGDFIDPQKNVQASLGHLKSPSPQSTLPWSQGSRTKVSPPKSPRGSGRRQNALDLSKQLSNYSAAFTSGASSTSGPTSKDTERAQASKWNDLEDVFSSSSSAVGEPALAVVSSPIASTLSLGAPSLTNDCSTLATVTNMPPVSSMRRPENGIFMPQPVGAVVASNYAPWLDDKPPPSPSGALDSFKKASESIDPFDLMADGEIDADVSTMGAVIDEDLDIDVTTMQRSKGKSAAAANGPRAILSSVANDNIFSREDPEPCRSESAADCDSNVQEASTVVKAPQEATVDNTNAEGCSSEEDDPKRSTTKEVSQTEMGAVAHSVNPSNNFDGQTDTNHIGPESNWLSALDAVRRLLVQADYCLQELRIRPELTEPVLSDPQGKEYADCLKEAYRVHRRIAISRQATSMAGGPNSTARLAKEEAEGVEKAWTRLTDILPLDFDDEGFSADTGEEQDWLCGLCRCGPRTLVMPELVDHVVERDGRRFHGPCANLWLSMVDRTALPPPYDEH
jgi:hypothetical protein